MNLAENKASEMGNFLPFLSSSLDQIDGDICALRPELRSFRAHSSSANLTQDAKITEFAVLLNEIFPSTPNQIINPNKIL